MVTLVGWYASLAVVQSALAAWVILAGPRKLLNWAVGSLLLLWAGSGLVFQLMREAQDPAAYVVFNRIASQYESPTFLLILLIADALLIARPRPWAWRALLALAAVAVPAIWLSNASLPLVDARPMVHGEPRPHWAPTLLPALNALVNILAEIAIVALAARAATDPGRSPVQRRQAALVGFAFALLVAQPAGAALVDAARGSLSGGTRALNMTAFLMGTVVLLHAVPRLTSPFQGLPRAVVRVVPVVTAALGGAASLPPYPFAPFGVRVVVLSGFALVLAIAVLRYDLADGGMEGRRRVQSAGSVLLGLACASLAVAAWFGSPRFVFGGAFLAVVLPIALLATPLRVVPGWMTQRILLHPRHPDALRERVRVYAATLRSVASPEGRVPDAAMPALAALRAQLGLSLRDHELLLAGPGRHHAGLVAYRLALANAEGPAPDAEELRRLRDDLGLSQHDHEVVLADLRSAGDVLEAGTVFRGRYRVLRRIGEGGFGEVWLARDDREGVDVVLKRLDRHEARDARALQRVQREVRTSQLVPHPNVVAVHGVETVGDETYLVMEHLAGGSLADVLRARRRLPEARVAGIGLDVLAALDALHARGVVHQDVKPANILLDAEGKAKLGDFTLARELVSGQTLGPEGRRGPVGTFPYLPPEQARGLHASPQADLYSLAASLYEALAGEPMLRLDGLSHAEAAARVAREPPAFPIPGASPRMNALLARALAKAPEDRFPDAASMAALLRDAAAAPRAPTPAGRPAGSDPRPPRPLA